MSSSGRDLAGKRATKSTDRDRPDADRTSDEDDKKIIEEQIGPGLRSMYSNVLSEDLPEDLLAVVEAMKSNEKTDGAETAVSEASEPRKGEKSDG
ncbi:MAG: NepR family anti-sigma factor [Pseudomonadota bacterium]